MSEEWVALISAFTTGGASLVLAVFSGRIAAKRAKRECDERVAELRNALRAGIDLEKEHHAPPET